MKHTVMVAAAVGLGTAAAPWLLAHHSVPAFYDEKKTVTIKGTVTKFEWNNPHVTFFVEVEGAGGSTANWAFEFDTTVEMRRAGWNRESLKVGDPVTVEGILARDGSKQVWGKSVTVASGRRLAAAAPMAPPAKPAQPKTTPRWPDGHPRFNPLPGETGYWAFPSAPSLFETSAGNIRMSPTGLLANIADAAKVAPFQPWAKGLYEYRQRNFLKDDPMTSCLPPGGPRKFHTPYGLQLLEEPERKRLFIMAGGANRNWRLIPLDGRALPDVENETPTYFGFSTGRWEGDTLVIASTGYNERFWFSNGGLPHTESLKLTERISRPDFNTLRYEVTVDDAGAYTRGWTSSWTMQWVADQEMPEYFCDDNNRWSVPK